MTLKVRGRGRSIFCQWKTFTIRLSYVIICHIIVIVILCTCLCFELLSHNMRPPLNPNAIELVEDVSVMFSIFCCPWTEVFAFGVPTMQMLEANDHLWPGDPDSSCRHLPEGVPLPDLEECFTPCIPFGKVWASLEAYCLGQMLIIHELQNIACWTT